MKSILPSLLAFAASAGAQSVEEPPLLKASEILRAEFQSGPCWKVREEVPTYSGRNYFTIDSEFGVFEAEGNAMLMRRVQELSAIRELREISKTKEYKEALKTAAKSPLVAARGLIDHPVKTVTGVPKGLFKMLGRAGQGVKNAAKGRERNPYEDSGAEQLIGFSKTKREVAARFGVDPYSSNEALQKELNGHSWTAFAGKLTFTGATLPIGGGLGTALTAANVTSTFNAALRDKSPADLRIMNEKTLRGLGCNEALAEAFLANPAFSPSAQTAFVLHLNELRGVEDVPILVRLANEVVADEPDALFFVESSRLLATIHAGGTSLSAVGAFDVLPVAWTKNGNVLVALEWDYASWTQRAADFVARLKAEKFAGKAPTGYIIVLSGVASRMAAEALEQAGVIVRVKASPGPLR